MPSATKAAQVRLNRVTPSHCRVVLDNPPLNLMGPEFVPQIREIVTALENDDRVKVVVFESAVDGFFLNHSDFLANLEDLTSIPQGPTGLEAWPDVLVRLTRAPFVSIALIRGRATGNGSELALACDMSFANQQVSESIAFHESAFVIGMAPLQVPAGVHFAANQMDPDTGTSVRIISDYIVTTDKFITRCDVLYGHTAQRPEWACRIVQ